jgi:Uma2 family endonuclease
VTPQTAERTTQTTKLYLTPTDNGRVLSLADFLAADGQEGFRYELIEGRLFVSPQADMPHDRLRKWLERQFDSYAEQHPDVINFVAGPARLFLPVLGEDVTAPEADLACYQGFPLHLPVAEVNWDSVTPYLVVEVISPKTAAKDLDRNVQLYLRVPSIREYWILDPREESYNRPSMTVYRRRGQSWQRPIEVAAGGTYATRFLPGFTLVLDRPPAQG